MSLWLPRESKIANSAQPGHWTSQTIDDRARETLAAVSVLRGHPRVDGTVGLLGVSQGGWVSVRAASLDDRVDFVISVSGPGVTPAAQERTRLERELHADASRPRPSPRR